MQTHTTVNTTTEYKSIFSFLWPIIKPYKFHYAMQLVAPIYTGLTDLIYFYCMKLIIDILIKPTFTYHELLYPLVIFFASPIILNILWRIANILEWRSAPMVRREILLQTYDYVQHHAYQFFQNNLSGGIISKIKGMLDTLQNLFSPSVMKDACMFSTMLISGVITLFFIDVALGWFVVAWLIMFFAVVYAMSKKLNHLVYLETESWHSVIGSIADKITNIISLFYFAARERELNTLEQQVSDDFIPKQIRVYKYDFMMHLILWALFFVMFGVFLLVLIHAREKQLITAGTIAFTFAILTKIGDAAYILSMKLQDIIRLVGDLRSSFEILKIPHTSQDTNNAKQLIITQPTVDFCDVNFSYGKNMVFAGLNLTIKPGENIGVVGYSGAGKTTLINILLKFFAIQQGDVLIDGQNINTLTADSIRANIAVIPQDIMLFHRSLLENIRYGNPEASDEEVVLAAKKAHIHEFIETLPDKYQTSVGERGIKLSGGQRQRIAIARAILKNAPILILDEATSSLDSKTEKEIQESINYILEKDNQTVIAIAHRLSTLRHMDRIIVLHQGKIVEEGTHDLLMQKADSLYKKLWHEQMI